MVSRLKRLSVAEIGITDYDKALALQGALAQARQEDRIGDTLLLLEHPHVYTLGRGADERFILANPDGVPVRRVSRGGQVTYHGPGQLVGYPILKLEGRERDVGGYLRNLEQAIIAGLARCDVEAQRRPGMTGVWIGQRKIASIGVGIRRWVTRHGFAVNVSTELRFFDAIVPCGIAGCQMTSIAQLGHPEVSARAFGAIMRDTFAEVFGYDSVGEGDPAQLAELADPSAVEPIAGV
ncbi:MAG TPA: lipoyl(octanoyl) transferase LipB [Candidatus Binataceae bacterium]|nr:lipoyl(octanoyl) transferase LipB [Candidatus Binataceae bacterium]